MKKRINESNRTITFTFDDGLDPVVFVAAKASPACNAYATLHGWQARIGDNAAIARKGKDGVVITVTEAMRREAIVEMVNHYHSGTEQWNMRAAAVKSLNPTWFAIAEKRGVSYETIAAEKAAADLAELKAM